MEVPKKDNGILKNLLPVAAAVLLALPGLADASEESQADSVEEPKKVTQGTARLRLGGGYYQATYEGSTLSDSTYAFIGGSLLVEAAVGKYHGDTYGLFISGSLSWIPGTRYKNGNSDWDGADSNGYFSSLVGLNFAIKGPEGRLRIDLTGGAAFLFHNYELRSGQEESKKERRLWGIGYAITVSYNFPFDSFAFGVFFQVKNTLTGQIILPNSRWVETAPSIGTQLLF